MSLRCVFAIVASAFVVVSLSSGNALARAKSPRAGVGLADFDTLRAARARPWASKPNGSSARLPAENSLLSAAEQLAADCVEWSVLAAGQMTFRGEARAVYDSAGQRMVVFAGSTTGFTSEVWTQDLSISSGWVLLPTAGVHPPSRGDYAAIYDPVRKRLVIFGGRTAGTRLNDVWALELDGTPVWSRLSTQGVGPSPRGGPCATYDPVRDRMLVFGGEIYLERDPDDGDDEVFFFSEVWALSLSTNTWSLVSAEAPQAGRANASAFYEPGRDRMIVLGGADDYDPREDVWALSLGGVPHWTQLAPSGPGPEKRYDSAIAYDSARNRVIVFGGEISGVGLSNDLFELALEGATPTWSTLSAGSLPSARSRALMLYDPPRDRLVMIGGYGAEPSDLTWELPLAGPLEWAALQNPVAVDRPTARADVAAIWDRPRQRMVVFGGEGYSGSNLDDLYGLDLSGTPAWSRRAHRTPAGGENARCRRRGPAARSHDPLWRTSRISRCMGAP